MEIKLYTTHCPRCNVLEKKLDSKGINYQKIDDFDINEMVKKGFKTAPILEVDNKYMVYTDAVKWVNDYKG